MSVQSFNFLGLTIPERSATKFLMLENWRERNMKKGMNKQQQKFDWGIHDIYIHDITTHCS